MKKLQILIILMLISFPLTGCGIKNPEQSIPQNTVMSEDEKEQKRVELVKRLEGEGYTNWHEGKELTQIYYKDSGNKRTVVHSGLFFEATIPSDDEYKLLRLPEDPTDSRIYIYKGNVTDHMRILDGMIIDVYSDILIGKAANEIEKKMEEEKLYTLKINNQKYLREDGKVYIYPGEYFKEDSNSVLIETILNNVIYKFTCATAGKDYEKNFLKCENIIQSIKFL